jgi:hypothetical protein
MTKLVTKHYADGTSATGSEDMPDHSAGGAALLRVDEHEERGSAAALDLPETRATALSQQAAPILADPAGNGALAPTPFDGAMAADFDGAMAADRVRYGSGDAMYEGVRSPEVTRPVPNADDAPLDGHDAYADGFDLQHNPFGAGTSRAALWADDWNAAKKEHLADTQGAATKGGRDVPPRPERPSVNADHQTVVQYVEDLFAHLRAELIALGHDVAP